MRRKMWMGTRGRERWIPVPRISAGISRFGFSAKQVYTNGGAGVVNSGSGHKEYNFTWNKANRSILRVITDLYEGVMDTQEGVNLIYFLDPFAMPVNCLPQNWATPSTTARNGMPLYPEQRPSLIQVPQNSNNFPARGARYRADRPSARIYIPIPPAFTAWVGFAGQSSGASLPVITAVSGETALGDAPVPFLPVAGSARFNASVDGNSVVTGLEISLPETGMLRNLDPNPSFELNVNGSAAIGGAPLGTVALTNSTAGGRVGSRAARATWSTAATAAGGGISHDVPAVAGRTYSFGLYARTSIATRVRLEIQWLNSANIQVGSVAVGTEQTMTAAPAWTAAPRLIAQGVLAPSGATKARLRVVTVAGTGYVNMSNGSYLEIDASQVNVGATVQAYNDGNSAGWEWIGSNSASPSRQTPDTFDLYGIMIQVLPSGRQPSTGEFMSGQGHSGCQFESDPTIEGYSVALSNVEVGMSANLIETGAWL